MRILLGKHNGFCFGVRRAVELSQQAAEAGERVYTMGALIHNESVLERLADKGISRCDDVSELHRGDILILRAHGVPPETERSSMEMGLRVIDATCPFVKKTHNACIAARKEGYCIVVAGEKEHPEVRGILGYAGTNAEAVSCVEEARLLPYTERVCLVAQTTFRRDEFYRIAEVLKEKCHELKLTDTICDTTRLRQAETEKIARMSTKMFVIGSQKSANTGRLYEIAKKYCKYSLYISNIDNFFLDNLQTDDIIGIVAGASTPDWMIREVIQRMSELENTTIETVEAAAPAEEIAVKEETIAAEAAAVAEEPADFATALEETMNNRIHNGQVLSGIVLQIVDGEVAVNIGYKSDGIIPKNEFSSDPSVNAADAVKVGDSIEVEVLKVNDGEGNVLLSHKNVEGKKLWDDLMSEAEDSDKVFEAVGKEVVKGGIIADINGIRAFVPASQVSTKYIENLSEYVGKPMRLKVLEVDKQRKRIVASQKQVLVAEAAAAKREKWEALVVGSKVNGVVRRLTDFGAFVDIGGIDGLVHVTDAAWGRGKNVSDIFTIGQEIEVLILNVDVEKERVSLGYKQLQPKPWTYADQTYPIGSIVEGKVVRIVPFGAFVSLESTIDGLIHISQVGVRRVEKVEDELKVGDVVRCKVLEVNTEAKRISLSRKQAILEEQPEIAEQLKAEREERDRQYKERKEQREKEKEQQQQQQQRRERSERPAQQNAERSENRSSDRRRRSSEDGEYELPPVQSATTSMADLLKAIKFDD